MKTVLTIDDSKFVRTMIARALAPWGCSVVEAHNGLEGVAVARRTVPDLIVLDVLMPVMDGREALATLRQDPVCGHIPVVMLTGVEGEQLVAECADLGIHGYLVKPFAPEVFAAVVGGVLGTPAAHLVAAPKLPTLSLPG